MDFSFSSPSSAPRPIGVRQLVSRIRDAVSIGVGTLWVEGELSNVKYHSSGHVYFTLKEQGAEIFCAFFRLAASRCPIRLQEGMKVQVLGEATVYQERGQLQLVIKQVKEAGVGDLQARFLALKEALQKEGLFDHAHKKLLPTFPRSIGIITSPTGAVIQDIRHVLERRAPWIRTYLLPVRVQGNGAEKEIASAIRAWSAAPSNGLPQIDVLIVGRGGGSIEDLWCFNEEIVARAIYDCPIPIISAVGHETDFTIADFVADHRAPTPTAAAEIASPDGPEWLNKLERLERTLRLTAAHAIDRAQLHLDIFQRGKLLQVDMLLASYYQHVDTLQEELEAVVTERIGQARRQLDQWEQTLRRCDPKYRNQERQRHLESLCTQLQHAVRLRLNERMNLVNILQARLDAQSPEQALKRGFALVLNDQHQLVRKTSQVTTGDSVSIRLSNGVLDAVIGKREETQIPG